jgi:PAS domain S-box-containing protein
MLYFSQLMFRPLGLGSGMAGRSGVVILSELNLETIHSNGTHSRDTSRAPLNQFPTQFPTQFPNPTTPDNLNPATVNPPIHANTNTTGNDASLRRIARMTARLLRAKSAIITLLDGTQIRYGLEGSLESSQAEFLEPGFAPTGEVMTISDLSAFLRHREHPLVKGGKARFLVHMALESNVQTHGQIIGTLCVLDPKPRDALNRSEHAVLNEFATLIVDWLEIRAELAQAKEMALENDDVPLVIEPAINANIPYSAAQTVHPEINPESTPASSLNNSAGFSGAVPDDIAPWMLAPWMQPQSENKNEAHAGALEGSTLTVLAVNNDAEITLLAGRAHPDLGLLNQARGQRLNEICSNNTLIDTVRRALEGERVTTRLNANLEVHAAPNLDMRGEVLGASAVLLEPMPDAASNTLEVVRTEPTRLEPVEPIAQTKAAPTAPDQIEVVQTGANQAAQLEPDHETQDAAVAFEYAPVGMALVALDGQILRSNRRLHALLGYENETIKQILIEFPSAERPSREWPLLIEVLQGRRSEYTLEKNLQHSDGSDVRVRMIVSKVPGAEALAQVVIAGLEPEGSSNAAGSNSASLTPAVKTRTAMSINNNDGTQPIEAQVGKSANRNTILEARDDGAREERERIARELHDGLGKDIFGLAYLLEAVAEKQRGRVVYQELLNFAQAARELGNQSRTLMTEYRTPGLPSFEKRLEAIVSEAQTTGMPPITLETRNLPELDANATFELARIIGEAFENIRRHANAKRVLLRAFTEKGMLELRVRDDGKGLPEEASEGRYGLRGMRERAELLGGTLELSSDTDGGTLVRVLVPIKNLTESEPGHD